MPAYRLSRILHLQPCAQFRCAAAGVLSHLLVSRHAHLRSRLQDGDVRLPVPTCASTHWLCVQETTDLLVGNLFFLAFGAALPWDHWFAQGPAGGFAPWRLVLLAVLLLCFKRLPFLLALYRCVAPTHMRLE